MVSLVFGCFQNVSYKIKPHDYLEKTNHIVWALHLKYHFLPSLGAETTKGAKLIFVKKYSYTISEVNLEKGRACLMLF